MQTKHRVLVIGVGSIGERHVRCFLRTGRAEVGVTEPNPATRDAVAERHPLCGAYASLDEALTSEWDSAVVATPAHTHIGVGRTLAASNIGALIEKPLSVSPDGVEALATEAQARGLPMGVAYIHRAHPALAAMREAVISGRFGRPLHVTVQAGQHFPTHRPAYASTYYRDHASGGGAIQDALTHLINAAEWLVGPVTGLAADAAHQRLPNVTVEDTVNLIARHGDTPASYSLNQHQAPNETHLAVVCEDRTMAYEPTRHRWRWCGQPDAAWSVEPTVFKERDDWFTQQANAWLDVLEGKQRPLCTIAEGAQTLRVNRAALASVRDGRAWQQL